MINTCSNYTDEHNLSFSVHDNPVKSKTKCMAFLKNKKNLRQMMLKDKALPWVNSTKHLGVTITDNSNMTNQDTLEKRAQYIARNNELMQAFNYVSPNVKSMINNIYIPIFMEHHCGIFSLKHSNTLRSHGTYPKESCLIYHE